MNSFKIKIPDYKTNVNPEFMTLYNIKVRDPEGYKFMTEKGFAVVPSANFLRYGAEMKF